MEREWVRSSSSRPVAVVEEAGRPGRAAGKTEVVGVVGRPVAGKLAGQGVGEEAAGRKPGEEVEGVAGSWVEERKRRRPAGLEVVEVVGRPVEADIEAWVVAEVAESRQGVGACKWAEAQVVVVVEEPIGRQEPVRMRPECKGWAEEICTAPEDCTAAWAEWAERRMPDERGRAEGPE
jgi:hypothetical protein